MIESTLRIAHACSDLVTKRRDPTRQWVEFVAG